MSQIRKKKQLPPEVKLRRKIKKNIRRLLLLGALAAFYFFVIPVLLPQAEAQIENQKQQIKAVFFLANQKAIELSASAMHLSENFFNNQDELLSQDPEQVIRSAVDDLKQRVKSLPQEQITKVKKDFCSDLLAEQEKGSPAAESGE